jgi:hypothetical protein
MRSRGLGIVAAALIAAGIAVPSAAQSNASAGLVVSPPVAELTILPGRTIRDQVTVQNRTDATLKVFVTTGDIEPSGSGFVSRPTGTTGSDSAAPWIVLSPSEFELSPGTTTTVTATIRAPVDTPVGGHFAGIQFATTITTSVGTTSTEALHAVLLEVPGQGLTRAGRLVDVTMPKFEINGRVPIRIRVENSGDTHLKIEGLIIVRDRLRRRTVATLQVPVFYVLPGTTGAQTVVWRDPPLFAVPRAQVHVDLLSLCTGEGARACEGAANGFIVHWWVIAGFAVFLLVLRLLIGVFGFRRRRAERRRERKAPPGGRRAYEPPAAAGSGPAARSPGASWDQKVAVAGSLALRRARTALGMLRQGAGETGVRVEVALGLLRSVRDASEVAAEVERAYRDAVVKRSQRESAALALALHEIDSPHAAEALLLGYAKADRVLALRLKRALAECDPADLRAHRDLLDALPASRRQALPVG